MTQCYLTTTKYLHRSLTHNFGLQVCHSVVKKLSEGVTSSSSSTLKGNDGAAVEKRIRKTAEFGLGQTFQENGRAYASHERPGVNAMSQFLVQGGLLLNDLASNQVGLLYVNDIAVIRHPNHSSSLEFHISLTHTQK